MAEKLLPGQEGYPAISAVLMENGNPASGAGQAELAVQTIPAAITDRRIAGIVAGLQSVQAEPATSVQPAKNS